MSRHRNIRSMDYQEEFDGYDEIYGHSVEEDYAISPSTASQFLYDRSNAQLSSFLNEHENIPEEDEGKVSDDNTDSLQDSTNYTKPKLTDIEEAQLQSCLEQMRNILGESTPEHVMTEAVIKANFNYEKALDAVLAQQDAPKPQRQPRERRERGGRSTTTKTDSTVNVSSNVPPAAPKVIAPSNVSPAAPKVIAPSNITAAPKVIAPSSTVSDGVARMTFTTGSKVSSGFTPQKDENEETKSDDVETVKKDLTSFLDPTESGRKDVGDGGNGDFPSTPKKSQLNVEEDSAAMGSTPKSAIKNKKNPEAIKAEYLKRKGSGKENINLVVIGHVDAGKSTLMGHVLYQLGFVNKKTMHKYEQESKKLGKASFAYAWVLDETEEERTRGVTMDVAQTRFETSTKIVTLLDAPGHKDFIPNMITGAAQADVAILVVNSTRGEFETGFEAGGQTREHAMLIRSLGVSQLIIAVNKMDTVDWAQERFSEIQKKLGSFLKTAGFRESDVTYVPCSGLSGENLTKAAAEPTLKSWYNGPCVVELIDKLNPPERQFERSFRQCITDVFKGMGAGISVAGIIQAGSVQPGDKVLIMPQGEVANVKTVLIDEAPVQYGFAGDNATLVLTGIDQTNLAIGSIICDPSNPIKTASRIRARVVVFNIAVPLTKGFPVVFHYQSLSEPAVIRKLVSQLHKSSGQIAKKNPRCLVKNTSAVLEIELNRPICVELYKDYKDLGRFMLRYSGSTIAAGLITELVDVKGS